MPKPIDGLWRLGAIEVKRHNNHDKTSQLYPGIVCVESGHCATIHWGLSNGLVIWLIQLRTWAMILGQVPVEGLLKYKTVHEILRPWS